MKRILSVILAVVLINSTCIPCTAREKSANISRPTGLIEFSEICESSAIDDAPKTVARIPKSSAIYTGEWDRYGCYALYNRLTDAEQTFWDGLSDICYKVLSTVVPCERTLDVVDAPGLSQDEKVKVLTFFYYSNPQYFFIDGYMSTSNGGTFSVCEQFMDGYARSIARDEIKTKVDSIISEASRLTDDETKVRFFFTKICEMTEYDADEEFNQSVYSIFHSGRSVCAGYSKTMAMLCNGSDIDAITVPSNTHGWNMIRLFDNWYNLDATWADQADGIYWDYYLKSDRDYKNDKSDIVKEHTPIAIYDGYLPTCNFASDANKWVGPTYLSGAVLKAESPKITLTSGAITMDADETARIYYTIDGTVPSESNTKAMLYRTGFTAVEGMKIRAKAVSDDRLDSTEVSFFIDDETIKMATHSTGAIKSVKAGKKKFTVKIVKLSIPWTTVKYQIQYKAKGGIWKTVTVASNSKTIKNLKTKKQYYLRVRPVVTVSGKKYTGKWSPTKKVKTK